MRIKKDKKTRNEYIWAGIWVRNFTKSDSQFVNINKQIKPTDHFTIIQNESANKTLGLANIADETFKATKAVIVSDGYDFDTRHKVLDKLDNIIIIAVNRALKKWNSKPINAYFVNNPYPECLNYLSTNYYPTCIASSRTNHDFLKQYKGKVYLYDSTPETNFGYNKSQKWFIDDYRNPICGAIGLLYRLGVEKLLLLCCDDVFKEEKPGAEKVGDFWMYPQHKKVSDIIDANLYWLKKKVANYSNIKYQNSVYLKTEEEIVNFFQE